MSSERVDTSGDIRASHVAGASELKPRGGTSADADEMLVIPLVEERLSVEKKTVETTRTVIHVVPEQQNRVVEVTLNDYVVDIKRVPIGRVVEAVEPVRREGEVTVIPVYEERLIVQKQLILKEEIRLTRHATPRTERQDHPVRAERVEIEHIPIKP